VGNVYVADLSNDTIRKITPDGVASTLAGAAGQVGSTDGTGSDARFKSPNDVATDSAGNVYVADSGNCTIRKITPAGVVSTLAGTAGQVGSSDGSGSAALFNRPTGVATDSAGNVYVADTSNYTIRKITPAGVVSTVAGSAGMPGSSDGSGSAAQFNHPYGIATDSAGNVYVADTYNYTIRKITPAGVVSTLAGSVGTPGSTDGSGSAGLFKYPLGIATDSVGNVYVADTGSNTLRKVTQLGVVTTVVGTPGARGVRLGPLPGSLNGPRRLAVLAGSGITLVAADGENAVLQITLP
jgi:sugar lactone lactonase YvrE